MTWWWVSYSCNASQLHALPLHIDPVCKQHYCVHRTHTHNPLQMKREFEEEERQMDRDWYDAEEFGGTADRDHAAAAFVGDDSFFQVRGLLHVAGRVDQRLTSVDQPVAAVCALSPVLQRAKVDSETVLVRLAMRGMRPLYPKPWTLCAAMLQKRVADLTRRTRHDGTTMSLAASKRASELDKDQNAWEENRLLTSGVARLKEVGGCVMCAMLQGVAA